MNEQQLGANIKARREELGLSQNDLAASLGMDQGKVSLIERGGRKVDMVKELPMLAKVLKKPLLWFFEEANTLTESDPVRTLLKQYFPDIEFSVFETRRIAQFLEPVLESYIKIDPEFSQRIANE